MKLPSKKERNRPPEAKKISRKGNRAIKQTKILNLNRKPARQAKERDPKGERAKLLEEAEEEEIRGPKERHNR